ncbi:helix-turn-helix transcriptional regulator [Tumebacillus sp. BK434]|uniref:helix-turn-helix transcriptional regulator n=1 Tax=Tumebacillus sp. BK434 TaxID=2512169 RepID=UPI0010508566|nr:helix-turn-helix transcriptional regulator [Tumebacillus sp. BK434]
MNESLGQRLRRLRKERNLSQTDLGNLVGVTISWISTIEQDRAMPSADLLNKIADAFLIPIKELLQDEDKNMELHARIKLVELLIEKNQPAEAEELIVKLQNELVSEYDKLRLSVFLADCKYQQGRFQEALSILQPMIQSLESSNFHDANLLAWIRNKIGNNYTELQETEEALYNYKRAYDYINRFIEFDHLAAYISFNVGLTLRKKGCIRESLPYIEKAGAYYEKINDIRKLADALYVLGIAYKNTDDFQRASEFFDQAKTLYQTLNNNSLFSRVQVTMAASITYKENPDQAIQDLIQCANQFELDNYHAGVVFVYAKIAEIHLLTEQVEEAYEYLCQAQHIASSIEISTTLELGELYAVFAKYHYKIQNYIQAQELAIKSSNIFAIIGFVRDQAAALQIAVDACRKIGNLEEALDLQSKRSDLFESLARE